MAHGPVIDARMVKFYLGSEILHSDAAGKA